MALDLKPLYGPAEAASRTAPLTRARPGEGWDIRAPVRDNAQALEALEGGAGSLLLQTTEIEATLAGVMLEAAPAALDAGLDGPAAARRLADAAKGSPAARLAFHLDPLTAFAEAGVSPGPIEAHLDLAAGAAAELAGGYPEATLMLASGRAVHEADGGEALELGLIAASALAYARALDAAGLPLARALGGIVLGVSVDGEVLTSIAKLRAARELWARITAACGHPLPARIEARGSRRMLQAEDPWTNLLRLTQAGFAGAAGGADALMLPAFTDALGAPAERARRLSRNIQLILRDECHLGRAEDPGAGAWPIEALTDQLARRAWAEMQAIEAAGGAPLALSSGLVAERVRAAREARVPSPIVGVTLYPDPDPAPVEIEDAAPWAPPPGRRLPGEDSRCPPLGAGA